MWTEDGWCRPSRSVEGRKLSTLYQLYSDEALRLAYLLTADPVLAEDLVQDAFVKLAGRPSPRSRFRRIRGVPPAHRSEPGELPFSGGGRWNAATRTDRQA